MSETGIDPVIVNMVKNFLLIQAQHSMVECLELKVPKYVRLAKVCNRIRYAGLVEGRIPKMWLEIVRLTLKESGQQISTQQWGRIFVSKLLNITHKQ